MDHFGSFVLCVSCFDHLVEHITIKLALSLGGRPEGVRLLVVPSLVVHLSVCHQGCVGPGRVVPAVLWGVAGRVVSIGTKFLWIGFFVPIVVGSVESVWRPVVPGLAFAFALARVALAWRPRRWVEAIAFRVSFALLADVDATVLEDQDFLDLVEGCHIACGRQHHQVLRG